MCQLKPNVAGERAIYLFDEKIGNNLVNLSVKYNYNLVVDSLSNQKG